VQERHELLLAVTRRWVNDPWFPRTSAWDELIIGFGLARTGTAPASSRSGRRGLGSPGGSFARNSLRTNGQPTSARLRGTRLKIAWDDRSARTQD
jgi:hypothetical protein